MADMRKFDKIWRLVVEFAFLMFFVCLPKGAFLPLFTNLQQNSICVTETMVFFHCSIYPNSLKRTNVGIRYLFTQRKVS